MDDTPTYVLSCNDVRNDRSITIPTVKSEKNPNTSNFYTIERKCRINIILKAISYYFFFPKE